MVADPSGPQYWDPLVGADEDSVPAWAMAYNQGYYNFYASTAGLGAYAHGRTNLSDSICPSGWQLPDAGSGASKQISAIMNYYVADSADWSEVILAARKLPTSVAFSGYYNLEEDRPSQYNSIGMYKTSRSYTSGNSIHYRLHPTSSTNATYYSASKQLGTNIRCVLR